VLFKSIKVLLLVGELYQKARCNDLKKNIYESSLNARNYLKVQYIHFRSHVKCSLQFKCILIAVAPCHLPHCLQFTQLREFEKKQRVIQEISNEARLMKFPTTQK